MIVSVRDYQHLQCHAVPRLLSDTEIRWCGGCAQAHRGTLVVVAKPWPKPLTGAKQRNSGSLMAIAVATGVIAPGVRLAMEPALAAPATFYHGAKVAQRRPPVKGPGGVISLEPVLVQATPAVVRSSREMDTDVHVDRSPITSAIQTPTAANRSLSFDDDGDDDDGGELMWYCQSAPPPVQRTN